MLYSCNVGHEFSFGFFQKSLNCCYDKDKGVLYTDDIKNFEKLDLNYHEEESKKFVSQQISELDTNKSMQHIASFYENVFAKQSANLNDLVNDKLLQQEQKNLINTNMVIAKFKNENEDLKIKYISLKSAFEDLIQIQKENQDLEEYEKKNQQSCIKTLKNSIGILNKKIKDSTEQIETLKSKFEALIDIVTEQKIIEEDLPSFLSMSNMSLKQLWSSIPNKNSAALMSIMLMGKKMLEDKGHRL